MGRRQDAIDLILGHYPVSENHAEKLYQAARRGGELAQFGGDVRRWFYDRLEPSMVVLDPDDYTEALIYALKVAPHLAGTDYGTSRQRDLGQLWTDTTRGLLGEQAVVRFFEDRFGLTLKVDYTLGDLEEYLPADITGGTLPNGEEVELERRVSVKTTKFQGIWLDITGAQIEHSDAFILAKIGVRRDHFVAYLKRSGFIDDILLRRGRELDTLTDEDAQAIRDSVPDFRPIPCYISGFMEKPIETTGVTRYRKRHTRSGDLKGYTIKGYVGRLDDGEPVELPPELVGEDIEFAGIGNFTRTRHYIANTGNLSWSDDEWTALVMKMTGRMPEGEEV